MWLLYGAKLITKMKVEAQNCRYIKIVRANALVNVCQGFVVLNL